ncbi:hypothetical protein Nepgr_033992, partial [Nepenthes gracilis]
VSRPACGVSSRPRCKLPGRRVSGGTVAAPAASVAPGRRDARSTTRAFSHVRVRPAMMYSRPSASLPAPRSASLHAASVAPGQVSLNRVPSRPAHRDARSTVVSLLAVSLPAASARAPGRREVSLPATSCSPGRECLPST